MAQQKVINSLYAERYPKEERKLESDLLSDEQLKFLESKGITKNGFNPPVDKDESTDYYYAKEFDVKIKGFSSAPKLSDVLSKATSGVNLTPYQDLMYESYKWAMSKIIDAGTPSEKWFEYTLQDIRRDLRKLRGVMARKRFVLLAGKNWFSDLSERDGAVVTLGDKEFTFTIRDIQVDY